MITAEEVTMKYSHFRLRVDLSKFFHDVRQFCWIFIDGTKIQQVIHIKQHISKLFNIVEPFHLLLNDTTLAYLPPTEDVRVLKESEIILVVPGSGISNESVMIETHNDSTHNEEISKTDAKTIMFPRDASYMSNISLDRKQPILPSHTIKNMTRGICLQPQNTVYNVSNDNEYTVINNTEKKIFADEVTDINLIEDCNVADTFVRKRKRVRPRKPKKRYSPVLSSDMNEKNILKKPKIIDSHVICPGVKHIRFDNIENDNICNSIVGEEKPAVREVLSEDLHKEPGFKDLNTLLALGQTSTPLTFVNKKINDIKVTEVSTNKIDTSVAKHLLQVDSMSVDKSKEDNKKLQKCEISRINLEKIPVMTRKPEIKDIIAFKTLKIDADYTPQESNFIITEVVDLCAQSANYTLKILDGKEEVQVPIGKFHISADESADECEVDTFLLNYSQMREPRLIP